MTTVREGFTELSGFTIDPASVQLLPRRFCEGSGVVVLGVVDRAAQTPVTVGMTHPRDAQVLAQVEKALGRRVEAVRLNAYEVERALAEGFESFLDLEHVIALEEPGEAPKDIPDYLDRILARAVRQGASDIHFECYPDDVDLRLRIDGILHQQFTDLSPDNVQQLIGRLKVLAQLDIAERRRPQDGRFTAVFDDHGAVRRIDFRISVVPTASGGEDAVLRVLDAQVGLLSLGELGLSSEQQLLFVELLGNPEGLVLVTGPTGSGKTTTLYSALDQVASRERKIVTAEDPIEYHLPKINQKQVSEQMPLGALLRALLRQDPDVMLVGEIRDVDTAHTATAAANTGHVVLGTLHTSDALGAVTRLRGLALDDADIATTLLCSVGQRLVRRLSPEHRVRVEPTPEQRHRFGALIDGLPMWAAHPDLGHGGYRGRVGIFEMLVVDDALQDMIRSGAHKPDMRQHARQKGHRTMLDDGLAKVAAGVTTLDEIARVVPFREIMTARNELERGLVERPAW